MRRSWLLAPLAAAALIVVVGALATGGESPERKPERTPVAHLWVDRDGGSCARSATPSEYASAKACRTLAAAYAAGAAGDRVLVRAGSYGDERVEVSRRLAGDVDNIVFGSAPGARVRLGDLLVYGSNAEFEGLRVRNLFVQASPGRDNLADVAFRDVDGTSFSIGPVAGPVLLEGGDWGPNRDPCDERPSWQNKISTVSINERDELIQGTPTGITLDGLRVHDVSSADLVECHTGGLMITGGRDLTIRNSRFERIAVYDIQVSPTRDTVLENNWFGAPLAADGKSNADQPEVQLSEPGIYDDWLIRHNSFHNGLAVAWDRGARHRDFRVIGNVGRLTDCELARGITWDANVWTDAPCSSGDRVAGALPYESAAVGDEDFHLTGGVAKDLVRGRGPDYRLGTDIDGDRRPAGRAHDAGSDEL